MQLAGIKRVVGYLGVTSLIGLAMVIYQFDLHNVKFREHEKHLRIKSLTFKEARQKFLEANNSNSQSAINQFVMLTTADSQFTDLMDNWLESIKRLGLKYNITFISEDDKAYKYYSKKQNDYFKVLNTHDYEMVGKLKRKGTTYQQLIKRRTMYVKNLLFSGTDVLLVDIDAVWLKDPIEILRQSYDEYDIWMAQGYVPEVPCPCFLYMKSVPPVMKLADQWVHRLSDEKKQRRLFESDQFALKYVLDQRPDLKVFNLDRVRFPTGKEFFDPEWNHVNFKNVYIAHGNHLGREVKKVGKLKEFGLWLLDK